MLFYSSFSIDTARLGFSVLENGSMVLWLRAVVVALTGHVFPVLWHRVWYTVHTCTQSGAYLSSTVPCAGPLPRLTSQPATKVRAIMQPMGSTGTTFTVANTGNKQNGEETGKWSASFSDISLMTRLSVFIGLCIFSARPFHHSPACSGSRICKNALRIRQHSSKCPACLLTLTEFVTDHFIPLQDFRSICGFSNVYGFHWL